MNFPLTNVFLHFSADLEVYLKSKINELQRRELDEQMVCSEDVIIECNKIAKRKSFANESKTSVYFTPLDSVEARELQLSPIHINYIRENNFSSCPGTLKRPSNRMSFGFIEDIDAELKFREKEKHCVTSVDNDHDYDVDDAERQRFVPEVFTNSLNSSQRKSDRKHRRVNSNDFYFSLENVYDAKPSNYVPMKQLNDLAIDETSEAQISNSSASDNCIAESNNNTNWNEQKPTPEKDSANAFGLHESLTTRKETEIGSCKSLPDVKRANRPPMINDQRGKYVVLAVESPDVTNESEEKSSTRRSF